MIQKTPTNPKNNQNDRRRVLENHREKTRKLLSCRVGIFVSANPKPVGPVDDSGERRRREIITQIQIKSIG